jgi:hypothetical protein
LEEKETKPKALGQATPKKAGHYARPLVCVLLLVKPTKLLTNGPGKPRRLIRL